MRLNRNATHTHTHTSQHSTQIIARTHQRTSRVDHPLKALVLAIRHHLIQLGSSYPRPPPRSSALAHYCSAQPHVGYGPCCGTVRTRGRGRDGRSVRFGSAQFAARWQLAMPSTGCVAAHHTSSQRGGGLAPRGQIRKSPGQ